MQETTAEWNQAQNDMQRYAMARCVAMVKKMIGQTRDYSIHLPKQPACRQSSSTTRTQTYSHELTHASAEISLLIAVVLRVKPFEWKCEMEVHYQTS